MKSYSDLFGSYGVITAMKDVDSAKYDELFGSEYDNELLDDYINFSNGNFILTKAVEKVFADNTSVENAVKQIAKFIWLKCYASWKAVLKTLAVDYNLAHSEKETTERTRETANTSNDTNTDNGKIFAFDSDNAVNDSLNDSTRSIDSNGNEKETITHSRNGYDFGNNLFGMLKDYRNEQIENVFCDVVKNDITSMLCYNIY